MSCISIHQLLGCSQDTQHLQIGWAAQIISCDWESCWGLAAASEELLVGKVGLHACPVSFPLKASQKHPEELLETHPRRAETAWPLRAGWQLPLVLLCTSGPTTRRGKSQCIQDRQSHLCLCKSPCRLEEEHTGLRAATFCSKGQSLFPSIFPSPAPAVMRGTAKQRSPKLDHRQKNRI